MSKVYGTLPASPAPGVPTDLTLDAVTAGYVTLSWTDDGTGTIWTVYRDGVPLGNVATQSYTDSAVAPSTLYSYQVQASSSSGSSALSAARAVTTSANTVPAWSLTDQSGVIGQSYSLNLNTVCDDVDGHSMTFTLTSGSVPGLSLSSPNYSGSPTTAGAYPLTFRANDGYGTSDVSITFTVADPDVTAPTVPSNVLAVANGSTVTVTWTASTDNSGVATYKIYRDGQYRASDAASPYQESGVPVGTYTYSVSAVDSSANANESAQSTGAPVTVSPSTPDVPANFSAVGDGVSTINLSWAAGPNGSAPDDYDLDFSATSASGPWTSIPIGLVTSKAHTGRTAGVQYFYRVRAGLGAVDSAYAATSAFSAGAPATFVIPASASARTLNGADSAANRAAWDVFGPNRVPGAGDIIELAPDTHAAVAFLNLTGSAVARITVRNGIGLVTVQSGGTYPVAYSGCSYVDFDFTNAGQTYGLLVRPPTASNSVNTFIKAQSGRNNHVTWKGFEIDGLETSWVSTVTPIGFGGHNQGESQAANPGEFQQENVHCTQFYIHNVAGEGMYFGPNYSNGSLPLRNIEIDHGLVEDTGRDGIQGKSWYEGTNSVHDCVVRRAGRNTADTQAGQLFGISMNSGQMDVYNCEIYESGESGVQLFTQNGPPAVGANGYGPYASFDCRTWNILVVDSGQRNASNSNTGHGITAGATNGTLVLPRIYAHNITAVNNEGDGINLGANTLPGWIRNSVLIGNAGGPYTLNGSSQSSNKTSGTLTADHRLTAEDAAVGTIGTDIAATDLDGVSRSGTASKGVYEFS